MSSRVSKWRQRSRQVLAVLQDSDEEMEDELQRVCNPEYEDQAQADVDINASGDDVADSDNIEDDATNDNYDGGCCSGDDGSDDGDSDDSESDEERNGLGNLIPDISVWAIQNNISHLALNGLMQILRANVNPNLPADARTVLNTPKYIQVSNKCGGEYLYFGIESAISKQLNQIHDENVLLTINVDGLPVFKSSGLQIWPILATINEETDPVIIALFCGSNKPDSIDDFLEDFLAEYQVLIVNGIKTETGIKPFKIKCFTCDAPARQLLKNVKGHTGYNSCERCTVKGEMVNRTMTFRDTSSPLRTDFDFNSFSYPNHQHRLSVLAVNEFKCVSNFVLDYMHLVCLGVVKRMLYRLKEGPRVCKLSQMQIDLISTKLKSLRNQLPSELARQPRSLSEVKRWKATEFKQFLLYTGMSVPNTLSLSVAISVMLSYRSDDQEYSTLLDFAKDLLKWFVDASSDIYGNSFVSYNVHSLIHLHQDVENFQCGLQEISTFPFENFMQRIKRMIRKNHQGLSQVARRMKEMEISNITFLSKNIKTRIRPISNAVDRDSWFMLKNKKICKVVRLKNDKNDIKAQLYCFNRSKPFFSEPLNSKLLNICFLPRNTQFVVGIISKADIFKKFVAIPEGEGTLLIPMMHSVRW